MLPCDSKCNLNVNTEIITPVLPICRVDVRIKVTRVEAEGLHSGPQALHDPVSLASLSFSTPSPLAPPHSLCSSHTDLLAAPPTLNLLQPPRFCNCPPSADSYMLRPSFWSSLKSPSKAFPDHHVWNYQPTFWHCLSFLPT